MVQSATDFQCMTLDVARSFPCYVYLRYQVVTDTVQVVADKEICGQRLAKMGKPVGQGWKLIEASNTL